MKVIPVRLDITSQDQEKTPIAGEKTTLVKLETPQIPIGAHPFSLLAYSQIKMLKVLLEEAITAAHG